MPFVRWEIVDNRDLVGACRNGGFCVVIVEAIHPQTDNRHHIGCVRCASWPYKQKGISESEDVLVYITSNDELTGSVRISRIGNTFSFKPTGRRWTIG